VYLFIYIIYLSDLFFYPYDFARLAIGRLYIYAAAQLALLLVNPLSVQELQVVRWIIPFTWHTQVYAVKEMILYSL
jgi:hypothetical protein